MAIQSIANRFGYQIRRLQSGVSLEDPYVEQHRLLPKPVHVVCEVGAADGRDTERYSELFPSARILAFEPVPQSFAELAKRAQRISNIVPLNLALSSEKGAATMHISNWLDASSLLVPKTTGSTFDAYQASTSAVQVATSTLDEVCSEHGVTHINLLKMDTQGAELKILDGARSLLTRGAIDLIYSEVHFMESYEGSALFYQLCSRLAEFGFTVHNLYGLTHNQKGQLAWGDAIFISNQLRR